MLFFSPYPFPPVPLARSKKATDKRKMFDAWKKLFRWLLFRGFVFVTLIAARVKVGGGEKEEIKEITCCFSPGIKSCVIEKHQQHRIKCDINMSTLRQKTRHENCRFRIQFLNFSLGSQLRAREMKTQKYNCFNSITILIEENANNLISFSSYSRAGYRLLVFSRDEHKWMML